MMRTRIFFAAVAIMAFSGSSRAAHPLVLMTDFGQKDGAVCEMKGVIMGVDPQLRVTDLTHEIPNFDIWEASYRLGQAIHYWPSGTVFVSVVDPGVGTDRNSIVAELKDNGSGRIYSIVTPNNGTLTLLLESMSLVRLHDLEEEKNRLPEGSMYHTFHGRDLYAFTGARLAAELIGISDVGQPFPAESLVLLDYQKCETKEGKIIGIIPVLDTTFGNVWSNISVDHFKSLGIATDSRIDVTIHKRTPEGMEKIWSGTVPLKNTFGDVPVGQELAYVNSLEQLALAVNQGNFAGAHKIASGRDWIITVVPTRAGTTRN